MSRYNWQAIGNPSRTLYARTSSQLVGKNQRLMHRYILGLKPGEMADHINGNGLDNRRCNLRRVTAAENARNAYVPRKEGGKTSKFKGVSLRAPNRWLAAIRVDGQTIRLGEFGDEEAAARAYDAAAIKHFGDFAKTNEAMGLFCGQTPYDRSTLETRGPEERTPAYWLNDYGREDKAAIRRREALRLKREKDLTRGARRVNRLLFGPSKGSKKKQVYAPEMFIGPSTPSVVLPD